MGKVNKKKIFEDSDEDIESTSEASPKSPLQTNTAEKKKIVPQMLPIEMNSEKIQKTVLTNIIKMLTNRGLLKKENEKTNIEKVLSIESDDLLYKIKLDTKIEQHDTLIIKLILQNISSVAKNSTIMEFFNKYSQVPKIVVVKSISNKIIYNMKNDSEYPNTEIFLEVEMMINIIEHVSVPKHVLLSDTEKLQVLDEYQAKHREVPDILVTDPIARYYNAKVGQMFRIHRASETSGIAPYYRLVIRGNIANL